MRIALVTALLLLGCSAGNDGHAHADLTASKPADLLSTTFDLSSPAPSKRAFLTSMYFSTGDLGGIDNADQTCLALAEAANLPGNKYSAWLSTSTANAIDRITSDGPWVTTEYEDPITHMFKHDALFANHAALKGDPQHPISFDEAGNRQTWYALTGTAVGGTLIADQNCFDWTDSGVGDSAALGHSDINNDGWTNFAGGPGSCNNGGAIYCLQQ